MTGIPAVTVSLDDGTGTFPYDISAWVEIGQNGGPIQITRGRADEFGEIQPGTCSLVLDNTDGRFSLGSTIINATSPIFVDNQIRVTFTVGAVTKDRLTGYVQTWPVEWPGGGDDLALARITAVDVLARLSRRPLRSVIEEEILLDLPYVYYTMGEPAGATAAGDTSGNGRAPLAVTGSGVDVVFGTATGPGTDSLTAVQFAAGKYLSGPLGPIANRGFTLIAAVNVTSAPASLAPIVGLPFDNPGGAWIAADVGNVLQLGGWRAPTGGPLTITGQAGTYAVGQTTAVAVAVNSAGNVVSTYQDGALLGTGSWTVMPNSTMSVLNVGSQVIGGTSTTIVQPNGVVAHLAIIPTELDAAHVAAIGDAMLNGFSAERSDRRISRYLAYGGVPTAQQVLEVGLQTNVPHYEITGNSVATAVAKVNEAEVGIVFARGDGKVVSHNRQHRQLKTTADWSLTAVDIGPATGVTTDMQQVANIATDSRQGGAIQSAQNAASITKHGQYPASYDSLLVATDAQALDRINWQVGTHAEPAARFNNLQVDLYKATQSFQENALAREVGDRIAVTGLASQAPAGLADQIVEGWTETLSIAEWSITFNTSPWALEQAWVLGDSADPYGGLGLTTRLGL